jgi:hypothetical protein
VFFLIAFHARADTCDFLTSKTRVVVTARVRINWCARAPAQPLHTPLGAPPIADPSQSVGLAVLRLRVKQQLVASCRGRLRGGPLLSPFRRMTRTAECQPWLVVLVRVFVLVLVRVLVLVVQVLVVCACACPACACACVSALVQCGGRRRCIQVNFLQRCM